MHKETKDNIPMISLDETLASPNWSCNARILIVGASTLTSRPSMILQVAKESALTAPLIFLGKMSFL